MQFSQVPRWVPECDKENLLGADASRADLFITPHPAIYDTVATPWTQLYDALCGRRDETSEQAD